MQFLPQFPFLFLKTIHPTLSKYGCWPSRLLHQIVTSLQWPKIVCVGFMKTSHQFFFFLSSYFSWKTPCKVAFYMNAVVGWNTSWEFKFLKMWTKCNGLRQGVLEYLVLYSEKKGAQLQESDIPYLSMCSLNPFYVCKNVHLTQENAVNICNNVFYLAKKRFLGTSIKWFLYLKKHQLSCIFW